MHTVCNFNTSILFIGASHNRENIDDARWGSGNHNNEDGFLMRNGSATKEAWTGQYYLSLASFAFKIFFLNASCCSLLVENLTRKHC